LNVLAALCRFAALLVGGGHWVTDLRPLARRPARSPSG
jgi:hypothetical protein